ncbi:MAG: glycosyltransferase family 9 protein [Candidatus Acidiferrales bacterium]|jgi:lipopolysaccharide heptosyltransferase I
MTSAERFLLVRLSSLGDLVHSVPVAPALRRSFPGARIDWVVDARWAPLMELVEGLDNVIPLDRSAAGTLACIRRLRRARYTCAIDIQGRYRSAVLAWLSGAPRRVGRRPEATREPGAAIFYTDRVVPAGKHIAEMNVSLAVCAGARPPAELEFPFRVPRDAVSRVQETLARQGISDYVVISPGGGWVSKCWPPERFGELCAEIWRRHELRAVINVAEAEADLARAVAGAAGESKPAVVSTSIPELAGLLSRARLVVAGDTGPLHLAAALGTRVVGLFGATDPLRNGPLPRGAVVRNAAGEPPDYVRGDYVRARDYSPAMLSLTGAQVLAAVEQELSVAAR